LSGVLGCDCPEWDISEILKSLDKLGFNGFTFSDGFLANFRRIEVRMSKFSLLAGAMAVIAVSGFAFAQSSGNHAPDGGTRVTISSIFIPAAKNAPFQATVTLEVTRHLADGSTVVIQNHRLVMRDSQGDIFQERRTLVPQGVEPQVRSIEISKPSTHTKYFCDPGLTQCELRTYEWVEEALAPTEPRSNESPYFKRINLGTKMIEGVDAIGTREILTTTTAICLLMR
jgi:hypothetical protein